MSEALVRYFAAEKQGSLVFVAVGLASVVAAVLLLRTAWRGAAFPFALLGLGAAVVGGAVWLRTDGQVRELQSTLARNPADLRAAEVPRMERVQRSFRIIKVVETALLAGGLTLAFVFPRGALLHGVGAGLALQAAILLFLDLVAARRADDYLEALRRLT
jgi:hypothetical protein